MMNRRNRGAGRMVLWNLKTVVGRILVLSLVTFLSVYLYARSTSYDWQPAELFTAYLGGFRRTDIFAVLWMAANVPVQIFLVGQIMDTFNKTYPVRVLKYRNKTVFCLITMITLTIGAIVYYAAGYGILIAFAGGEGLVTAIWQAGLSCAETLMIVCSAFLIGQLFRSWENLAFPVVLVIELFNTLLCGAKGGFTRLLPFTQGKLAVQKEYFFSGTAMAVSLLTLGCLMLMIAVVWKRKDERND